MTPAQFALLQEAHDGVMLSPDEGRLPLRPTPLRYARRTHTGATYGGTEGSSSPSAAINQVVQADKAAELGALIAAEQARPIELPSAQRSSGCRPRRLCALCLTTGRQANVQWLYQEAEMSWNAFGEKVGSAYLSWSCCLCTDAVHIRSRLRYQEYDNVSMDCRLQEKLRKLIRNIPS